jgi:sarcosine oxidase subunit alpha
LIDVSTLGKFRLFGPDAQQALERIFVGDMCRIPQDRVKYVAMCNDDGCLIDDGLIVRPGEKDYYFTTTTGRAGQTLEWFRYHTRYENWDYHLVNLTDAYGAVNLAGPKARVLLHNLTDADLSNEAFPYLGFREITLAGGVKARVMRLGFVGELSYEIHVPASVTRFVWDLLLKAGQEFNLEPFGLEAQNVLRLEKGHILIGQDTEIRVTLLDLGLGVLWHREKKEARTVGAPALRFTEHQKNRLKLVGFQMENPEETPGEGAIVVDETVRGHITSSRFSAALGQSIGLALVDEPLALVGTELSIFQEGLGGRRLTAKVVERPFYDPEGKRLRM